MHEPSSSAIVELDDVSVRFGEEHRSVTALDHVSLRVCPGEFVSVTGPSGSGKTTLLNVMSGLEYPDSGRVLIEGVPLAGFSDARLSRMRRRTVVRIFQFFGLLPMLTARQNVELPLRADGLAASEIESRALGALENVGVADRAGAYPNELSGGEQQRVGIARALATDARLILADEPTGNLDRLRSEEALELLRTTVENDGRSVILVTHDLLAAAYGDRMITLRDGRIENEVAAEGAGEVVDSKKARR